MDWYARICLEAMSNDAWPWFTTLTWMPDALPEDIGQCVRDAQLFFKRVRNAGRSHRYVYVLETGSKKGRLHWHGIHWMPGTEVLKEREMEAALGFHWKLGWVDASLVRGSGGLAYVTKYIQKGGLSLLSSSSLGRQARSSWRRWVEATHAVSPFAHIGEVPDCYSNNMLGRTHTVRIPQRDLMRFCKEKGVPHAPEINTPIKNPDVVSRETILQYAYTGVPSGPLLKTALTARGVTIDAKEAAFQYWTGRGHEDAGRAGVGAP